MAQNARVFGGINCKTVLSAQLAKGSNDVGDGGVAIACPIAVAPVVVGALRREFVLERGSDPLHAAAVPKNLAFVTVPQL